jgi:hypothetical protein
MRKSIFTALILMTAATVGCSSAKPKISEKTLIKCSACGAQMTVHEGLEAYETNR